MTLRSMFDAAIVVPGEVLVSGIGVYGLTLVFVTKAVLLASPPALTGDNAIKFGHPSPIPNMGSPSVTEAVGGTTLMEGEVWVSMPLLADDGPVGSDASIGIDKDAGEVDTMVFEDELTTTSLVGAVTTSDTVGEVPPPVASSTGIITHDDEDGVVSGVATKPKWDVSTDVWTE